MLTWISTNILLTLSLSLLLASSPFTMGLTILLIALMVSSLFSLMVSSWFAFLIYLIYVGGMLVMFSYFLALTPNQSLIMPSQVPSLILTLLLFSTLSLWFEMWVPPISIKPEITALFQFSNTLMLILLTLFLFFTMIAVVKLCTSSKGPLRAFMSYV